MKPLRAILCFLILLLSPLALANITIDGETINVETDAYTVQFDRGTITQLHNKLTGETYTRPLDPRFRIQAAILRTHESFWARYGTNREIRTINPNHAEILFTKGGNQLRMTIAIEPNTNDLLISGNGVSDTPGVFGVQWGIENLDLHNLRLVVPSDRRQVFDASSAIKYMDITYPSTHWEAQLAIIEAEHGGFYVRGTDPTFQFKRLNYKSDTESFTLGFQTHNQAPWDTLTSANSITWRLNTYTGDWCVPAQIHRDWMEQTFDPWRLSDMPAWVSDIGLVAIHQKLEKEVVARLAEFVDPTKTLLYLTNWRKEGHDINIPDYSNLHERFEDVLETAQQHGFRIMLHVNVHNCSPSNPIYTELRKYQYRSPWTGEVAKDKHLISLASSQWRDLHVQQWKTIWEKYNIDAFFLDVSHYVANDANGLIEGLTSAQGNVLLHKQLVEAMPGVVLSGEHLHEVTFFRESFARRSITEGNLHPISAFLFGPYTHTHGGIGTPNTIHQAERYQLYLETANSQGYLPTLWVPRADTFDDPLALQIFSVARQWQALGLRSNINCDWSPNTLFQYSTQTGETVTHNGSVLVMDNPDLNRDGQVNVLDLIIISNQFGQQVPQATPGDLNGDGFINILDLVLVAQAME